MKSAQNIFKISGAFSLFKNQSDKIPTFFTAQKELDKYIVARYTDAMIYRSTIYRHLSERRKSFLAENIALTESTYYILLALYRPQHGYGIMQQTEQLSGGRVRLAAGTLYGALNSLCEKGWIRLLPVESGSRKKEYQLTPEGLQVLKHELARLQQLVANGESILQEELS